MKVVWEARGWPLTLALLFVTCSLTVDFCRGDDGACPNNTCANSSLCCSQYFYCGSNASYCGTGCLGGPCYSNSPSISPTTSTPIGSCGPNNPCGGGNCCSQDGYCGSNASYCGTGCLGGPCYSNSPSISPTTSTPIGSCGPNNPCGGGNCCSQDGYCGSTPDYCGCGCTGGPCYSNSTSSSCSSGGKSLSTGLIAGIAIGSVLGAILLLGACLFVARRRTRKKGNVLVHDLEAESFEKGSYDSQLLRTATFASTLSSQRKRLSSETLHLATNGFSHELGRGAFGVVYKGTLEDGQEIAVKKMLDGQRDAKDFEAEVKTLGSINHANLVDLHGFTLERNELYLIYEFVANGSLDQWIFEKQKADKEFVLPWQTRVDILKGTARGLSYLHGELQGGKAIVHLDIKPQNILLDECYVPKIADFGLAKLLGSETTRQTLAAGGTMGYMAPEVYLGAASPKMDVYSFGMVLLEVVCGREHMFESSSPDSLFLPAWTIRKIKVKEQLDVVDPLLKDHYDANLATRLIWIALLCLQRDQDERPDMSNVLKMMEGILIPQDLPPTLQSEFEMAEKLIRKRVTGDASLNFIKFSGSSRKHKKGDHQSEAEESEKRQASNSGADNDFKLS